MNSPFLQFTQTKSTYILVPSQMKVEHHFVGPHLYTFCPGCCVVWQQLKCATRPFLVISDDEEILCLTRSTNFLKGQQHKIIAVSHASAFTSHKIILAHLFWFHSENELGHGQWTHHLMKLCMSTILQHSNTFHFAVVGLREAQVLWQQAQTMQEAPADTLKHGNKSANSNQCKTYTALPVLTSGCAIWMHHKAALLNVASESSSMMMESSWAYSPMFRLHLDWRRQCKQFC